MVRDVLVGHLLVNGADEAVEVRMQAVGIGKSFEMKPETLDRVEEGTVFGQPDYQEMIFQCRECCSSGSAGMVRGIVHHQHEPLVGINGERQVFEKGNESVAVLLASLLPSDIARRPIVSAENMAV